jgi:triacylglycerol lipase
MVITSPPVPVLLVPGWSDRARALRKLAEYLLASGWPVDAVHSLEFADRYGSNLVHAREIACAVEALLAITHADRIDVVAHSMGGLATRRYLADHAGAAAIRRAVFLATPHRGTWAALFAYGGGRREMLPGSQFLRELAALPWPTTLETAAAVWTRLDMRVLPHASAVLEAGRNLRAPLVTHKGLLRSARVHRLVCDVLRAPVVADLPVQGIPQPDPA